MGEIKIFENENFGSVRIIIIDDNPWFVGKDVAEGLGYERPTKAIRDHVDPEDIDEIPIQDSIGRMQKTPVVNESGFYSLVLSSKLPTAKAFKRWVTSDILPSIRKQGVYMSDDFAKKAIISPEFVQQLAGALIQEREEKNKLKETLDEAQPVIDFGTAILSSHSTISFGEMAKILKGNGINIGRNRFIEWLRENEYIIKNGPDKNMPTQKGMEAGLFQIEEVCLLGTNPHTFKTETRITPKGQKYFIKKIIRNKTKQTANEARKTLQSFNRVYQ